MSHKVDAIGLVETAVYLGAIKQCEGAEHAGFYLGNGHHFAQHLAVCVRRWLEQDDNNLGLFGFLLRAGRGVAYGRESAKKLNLKFLIGHDEEY